jgi:hypothetical protein
MGEEKEFKYLEEGSFYTISFDDRYTKTTDIKIFEIKVLLKLNKSIKIKFLSDNKISWFPSHRTILLFDEIPISCYRKEKLEKLDNVSD